MEEIGLEPSIVSRNLLFDLKHNADFTPIPPVRDIVKQLSYGSPQRSEIRTGTAEIPRDAVTFATRPTRCKRIGSETKANVQTLPKPGRTAARLAAVSMRYKGRHGRLESHPKRYLKRLTPRQMAL
jgi:hypothetical protein